jgi:tetratricopeptide (TPR) repeat protein
MTSRCMSPGRHPGSGSAARGVVRASMLCLLVGAGPMLAGCGAHMAWFRHDGRGPAAPHAAPQHRAKPAVGAAVPEEPRGPAARFRRAEGYVAADSMAMAESELRAVLASDPDDAPALALLSRLYFEAGRHREAIALLDPVRSRPEAFDEAARRTLLAGLSLHEDALGRTDRAREALAAAGGGGFGSVGVYLALRGEAPDSASEPAKDALRHDGRSAVNLNNFGITRLRAGDLDSARRAFAGAIERDPGLPGPYYNLAIMEKFYRFDDTAATRWFGEYWKRSHADPDSLRGGFGAGLANVAEPSGGRP